MALIKCLECGKEISDKASACIHCGYPLDDVKLKMVVLDGIVEEPIGTNIRGVTNLIEEFMGFQDEMDTIRFYQSARKTPQVLIENIDNLKAQEIVEKFSRFQAHITIYNMGDKISDASSFTPSDVNAPNCPTCHSTKIRKLGIIDKSVSVGLLGLASSKVGKTFQCDSCGYTW